MIVQTNAHPLIKPAIVTTILILLLLLFVTFAGGCETSSSVQIGNTKVDRDAVSLDLRNSGITDISPLLLLDKLEMLDIRDNMLVKQDIEKLQAALPACTIIWSVPFASTRADSSSHALTLPDFSVSDIELLAFFPDLVSVDASGSTAYLALREAVNRYPSCHFSWTVVIGDGVTSNETTHLDLSGQSFASESISAALDGLPNLVTIDLRDTSLDNTVLTTLINAHPLVTFFVDMELFGHRFDSQTQEINLSALSVDGEILLKSLAHFPELQKVNLSGCMLSGEDKKSLLAAYPDILFVWDVELLPGFIVSSTDNEIVVTGYSSPDVDTLINGLAQLPALEKLDLCACYPPSDDTNIKMERLMEAYPEIKIIWLVMVGNWELRTDIIAFSMGNQKVFDGGRYIGPDTYTSALNDRIIPIKYCTDLIALDMGHAKRLTDISCFSGLTKIRYLILGMTSITSLEPLSGMTELEFLECYQCYISDLSPLLNCKKLKYLNCSTTFVETIDDIVQMTQLKRLWIFKPQKLTKNDITAIKEALPNTIIASVMPPSGHSTVNGWRTKNPAYLHMQRDLFKLVLQGQRTKRIGDEEYWSWNIEEFEAR